MTIKFGRAKHFEKIRLKDVLRYPIWVSAHDDRHDEEYEKPIVNSNNVTEEIDKLAPIITFKVEGQELYGAAYYSHAEKDMFAIALWVSTQWITLEDYDALQTPATFISVPRIRGETDVKFVCRDRSEDRAFMIA
jgi:hypothetical protein